jgi:serine/threonine-protein kinase
MHPEHRPRSPGACPVPDILTAYSVGKLPVEDTRAITEHVECCDSCAEFLERLDNDDTLIMALRRHVPASPTSDEPARDASPEERGNLASPRPFPCQEPGQRVGCYELLEKIGQGAMGVVYKARQLPLKRLVALKLALPGGLLPLEASTRFHTEGEAIARLQHPNIVCVHDFGEQDGQPFFSMELVEGQSLAQKLSGGPLSEREAAELVRTLALAVAFAHQQGVIHRDLKPANVLLAADGAVKLTDFGLARILDTDTGQTQRQMILGTASYMAPEQARGDVTAVGPLADVYGLGAILYEAITGQPPFRAATRAETLSQVQHRDPVPPSGLRSRACPYLEAVCLKCLEKDPAHRYPSAAALADDLGRWLCNRDPLVRPAGPLRRAWKAIRRRPGVAASVLAGLLAVVGAGMWWNDYESRPERRYARETAPAVARLQRGAAVDLIEPGGKTPAFAIRCGEGITKARMTEEGFVVTSPGLGIVELLPRIPVSHYRISIEFRQDRTPGYGPVRDCGVGMIFSHRCVSSSDGWQHVVGLVGFDDWTTRKTGPADQGNPQCQACVELLWYLDTPTDGRSPFRRRFCYPPHAAARYPSPTGQEGILHSLEIDVAPEGITALLGDAPGQQMGPLRPDHYDWFSNTLRTDQEEVSGVELGPLNQPVIGVLVGRGQCTIRRLRIVPHPDTNP